jgi:TRAP-type C4-dicarboxylate transport system permease small subunit
MNPEEKQLLQKTYYLAEENNKILHKLKRANTRASLFRWFYWIVIIGISIGAFYFLEPYIKAATNAYKSLQTEISNVKSVTNKVSNFIK